MHGGRQPHLARKEREVRQPPVQFGGQWLVRVQRDGRSVHGPPSFEVPHPCTDEERAGMLLVLVGRESEPDDVLLDGLALRCFAAAQGQQQRRRVRRGQRQAGLAVLLHQRLHRLPADRHRLLQPGTFRPHGPHRQPCHQHGHYPPSGKKSQSDGHHFRSLNTRPKAVNAREGGLSEPFPDFLPLAACSRFPPPLFPFSVLPW